MIKASRSFFFFISLTSLGWAADVSVPLDLLLSKRPEIGAFSDVKTRNIMTTFTDGYKKHYPFTSGVYPVLSTTKYDGEKVYEWLDLALNPKESQKLNLCLRAMIQVATVKSEALEFNRRVLDKDCSDDDREQSRKTLEVAFNSLMNICKSLEIKIYPCDEWIRTSEKDNRAIQTIRINAESLFYEYLMNLRGIFSFSVEACNQINACLAKRTLDEKFNFLTKQEMAGAIHDCTHTEPAIIYSNENGLFGMPGMLDPCMLSRKDACELCLDKLENAVAEAKNSFPKHVVFISESAYRGIEDAVDYEGNEGLLYPFFKELQKKRIPHLCFVRIPRALNDSFKGRQVKVLFYEKGHSTLVLGSEGENPDDVRSFF